MMWRMKKNQNLEGRLKENRELKGEKKIKHTQEWIERGRRKGEGEEMTA